mmetsp:Transcript_15502/g.23089  ORF Transcript_15502/g.23089 Transcript_15502/m.23089 type:complete len:113 (-) Transcript_15502:62-400(-)
MKITFKNQFIFLAAVIAGYSVHTASPFLAKSIIVPIYQPAMANASTIMSPPSQLVKTKPTYKQNLPKRSLRFENFNQDILKLVLMKVAILTSITAFGIGGGISLGVGLKLIV